MTINEKKTLNLRDNKEGNIGGLGRKKEKEETMLLYCSHRNKRKKLKIYIET